MANFCQNCGAPMTPGAKFCTECGAPAAESPTRGAEPSQPSQPSAPPPPVDAAPSPAQESAGESGYRRVAAVQAGSYAPSPAAQAGGYAPSPAAPAGGYAPSPAARRAKGTVAVEKKEKRGGKGLLILLLILLIALVGFFGFRDGGWFRGGKSYDPQHMQSLLDYAQELEKAGNSEAAAAVYERIAEGGGAELIQKAHEDMPVVEKTDEIEQMEEVFGHLTGGGR